MDRKVIDHTTPVAAPLESVSKVMLDIDRWPEWTPGLKRIKRLGDGAWRPGQRFVMYVKAAPYLPVTPILCTTYEVSPTNVTWGVGDGSSTIRHSFLFSRTDEGRTEVRQVEVATGLWAAATFFAQPFIYGHDLRWQKALQKKFARSNV